MENNQENRKLKVSAIKNGTVLDHIPSDQIFRVIDILGLNCSKHPITFGVNLDSKSMKSKGIIKISEKFFEAEELNKIALIAPQASVNIIKDFEVIEKKLLTIPEKIEGFVKCMNPVCVTNHQDIKTKFTTIIKGNEVQLRCSYCEKITESSNFKIVSNSL